jgi:hypothetical protein
MVQRRIYGPKEKEVVEGWRRLQSEEFHNLYASPNIIRVIKPRRIICSMWDMRNAYNIVLGKPVWKRPLRRPWHRWEY